MNISNADSAYTSDFTFLTINLNDNDSSYILSVLSIAHAYMLDSMKNGNCLVHWYTHTFIFSRCGRSRSPALIISLLMKYYGFKYFDAYQLVKAKRPLIDINKSFQTQLIFYEAASNNQYQAHQLILYRHLMEINLNNLKATSVNKCH